MSGRVLLVCCALAAGATFALTRYVDHNVLVAAVAKEQKVLADFKVDQYDKVVESLRLEKLKHEELQGRLSSIDAVNSKALKDKQDEIDRLAGAVERGPTRLFVNAKCPAPAGAAVVPQAATPGRVDPPARAELDPTARQDYFALRRGLEVQAATLAACQSSLDELTR